MPNLSQMSSQCTMFTANVLQTKKSLGHYINLRGITVSVDYPSHLDCLSLPYKSWHTGASWGRKFWPIDVRDSANYGVWCARRRNLCFVVRIAPQTVVCSHNARQSLTCCFALCTLNSYNVWHLKSVLTAWRCKLFHFRIII